MYYMWRNELMHGKSTHEKEDGMEIFVLSTLYMKKK